MASPMRNTEYEIFVFRQTQQLPGGGETFEIEPVDTASTRWERWVRRFDNFVVAKGINNDT